MICHAYTKRLVIVVLLVATALQAHAKLGTCSSNLIQVEYLDTYDYELACEAVSRTEKAIKQFGLTMLGDISIHFSDHVIASHYDDNNHIIASEPVVGLYRSDTGKIWFTARIDQKHLSLLVFGKIPLNLDIYISMLSHEIAHRILDSRYRQLGSSPPDRAAHEFFASTIQLSVLNNKMRQSILALWPDDSFENNESINSIAYMMNPHRFAVMAYRFSRATEIMQQIINNTFLSSDYLIA